MIDPVRQKKVAETPEERVRQAVIEMLTLEKGVPAALLAVEKAFMVRGEVKRADIVIYDRTGFPWMVVECKAPDVAVSQETLDQVANYNSVLGAPYIFVTNGTEHICAHVSQTGIQFLDTFPSWPS